MAGSVTTPTGALSTGQIAAYAYAAGFRGEALVTAVAVALAESGGRPGEIPPANSDGSRDRGLWQINTVHGGADRDLQNPATNAAYAFKVSNGGKTWSPWVAWKDNAHLQYVPGAQAAVDQLAAQGFAGAGGPVPGEDLPIIGGPIGAVNDALSQTARALIKAILPVGLQVVFTVAGLGLIAMGLARLTERSPTELFNTATKVAGVGGIARAVATAAV